MKRLGTTLKKNALANLVRGGATAAVAIVLPRFLTRSLDTDHFAAWSLILQIAAYASYLDFGLQTAIARFIAQAMELEQRERQAKLVSTSLVLLSLAGCLAFCIISLVVWKAQTLFHGVPAGILLEFQRACLLMALSACLLLPLSTYTGILIGMHRNEIPAVAIGCSRIVGAAAAVVASRRTQSLVVLALCIGVPNVLGGLAQMSAVRVLIAEGRTLVRHVSAQIGRELLRFCAGLMVMSVGMLIVGGLDVTIVGHFQFEAVGYYSIASILMAFLAGLNNSVFSAIMAPVAALHARAESERIRSVVLAATRYTMLINLAITAAVFLWGAPLLRLWVGPVYAMRALPILKVLTVAQTLRLMMSPYSFMLISIGEQNKGIPGAIYEPVANLTASILGMIYLGPVGVAWGTLFGSLCGLVWIVTRLMPVVESVNIGMPEFFRRGVLPVSLPFVPLAVFYALERRLSTVPYAVVLTLSLLCVPASIRWPLLQRRHTVS